MSGNTSDWWPSFVAACTSLAAMEHVCDEPAESEPEPIEIIPSSAITALKLARPDLFREAP